MKNYCIICGLELDNLGELCDTCLEFFTFKYKKGLKRELGRFRITKEFLDDWRSQSDEKEVKE